MKVMAVLQSLSARDDELSRLPGGRSFFRAAQHHDEQRQGVGGRVEEVVSGGDPDRLQRGAERGGPAEQQRRIQAAYGIPAREDDERDRHQPLPARQALVVAAGIEEREEGAADASE